MPRTTIEVEVTIEYEYLGKAEVHVVKYREEAKDAKSA